MLIRSFIRSLLLTFPFVFVGLGMISCFESAQKEIETTISMSKEAVVLHNKNYPARTKHEIVNALKNRAPSMSDKTRIATADTIVRYGIAYGIDPLLLTAVMETESSYKPEAVSNKGAVGLMQLRPFVANSLLKEMKSRPVSHRRLHSMKTNIRIGAFYLSKLLKMFDGNVTLALEAYNRGPYRLKAHIERGVTINARYTRKVMKARNSIVSAIKNRA